MRIKIVIFCDSKSGLESIDNQVSKNPLMINILDKLQELNSKYRRQAISWSNDNKDLYSCRSLLAV